MTTWWIKSGVEQKRWIRDTAKSNKNKKSRHQLYYCLDCSHVWETGIHPLGMKKYAHMPTYGLTRKQCKECGELHEMLEV